MMRRVACGLILCALSFGCGRFGDKAPGEDALYQHQVTAGETLKSVARQYYLDPAQAARIGEFNHIDDGAIREGMTLRVPMTTAEIERLKIREQARVPYNQGLALAENGGYLDAVERFRAALAIDGSFADAYYNTGVSLQMMKSYDRAIDSFKRAIREEPGNPDYEFAIGNGYFYQESYKAAAGAFERTIALKAAHAKAHYSLAVCYEKLARAEDAKRTWQRYLELDPKSVWATEARKHLEALE